MLASMPAGTAIPARTASDTLAPLIMSHPVRYALHAVNVIGESGGQVHVAFCSCLLLFGFSLDNDLYSPIVRSAFGARIVGDWANLADSASGKNSNDYNVLRP
jgi:hypothetical protein